MKDRVLLIVDALVNFVLGALLLIYPEGFLHTLGLPLPETPFFPSLLGAVILGISLALGVELLPGIPLRGLGLAGAVCINLTGGLVLALWLLLGDLGLHGRGVMLLWGLVLILFTLSLAEIIFGFRRKGG